MNEKKWKRFFQNEMNKEMQEIDGILDKMNSDPKTKDINAPDELHEKLIAQIREKEAEKERLSEDEKELIHLGKVYRKRRKWNKVLVLVAALVCAGAIGVTSMGGPDKVIQKVSWMIGDRKQTNIDTDDERVEEQDDVTEAEAYAQIEEKFRISPVKLYYLPEGIEFESISSADGAQNVCMCYSGWNKATITYTVFPNYRTGSIGRDVEDTLIDEYDKVVQDNTINIKEYLIEESQTRRYKISYEYQNVFYFLEINNVEDTEVEKIVENLFFANK